jgi:heat shock protein HtpX
LLNNLADGEIEAVIGHELGHLKHRDVQVMMVVSFLPALFYYIGYSLILSGMFGGQRRGASGNNALIGIGFMAFSWILTLFTLYLSRLREYYADRHTVSVVDNGATKLSTGLARIVNSSRKDIKFEKNNKNSSAFKALFISDPDRATFDSEIINAMQSPNSRRIVEEILLREVTFSDKLFEVLSTHPNIVKRLRALKQLS